ncbi:MAG: NmrA family NAD(P)-binding protein [SAR324 cluster bacterium]|nr:NmrA family NAD(P)-binding protein [SAR324 cluster bacterium]
MKPKILVTSAAGNTGFPVAKQLLEKGHEVRAFVHRPSGRAEQLRKAGAEIFTGNMLDIRDVRRALAGVQRAYYAAPVAPNHLHTGVIFAAAANEARLETVTKMTQWFSQPVHPSFYTREHWLTDEVMAWMPNVDVVTINPSIFADFYFYLLAPIAQLGMFAMPLGDSLNAPPSKEDMARVAVGTLADPAAHVGKYLRPTGPALLSPTDMAEIFSKVFERRVKYMNVSHNMFLKAATALGLPPFAISQARFYNEEHQRGAPALNAPNDVVREVGGREPEDFETIARRYKAERPEAVQSFGNKLRALAFFARMVLTPTPDMERYERGQNHAAIENPAYSMETREWLASHEPQAAIGPRAKVGSAPLQASA